VCWYKFPANNFMKATPERTDIAVSKTKAPKGVTIKGISETRLCEKCEKALVQAYSDYPVFDLKLYDENAFSKINDFLKDAARSRVELALSNDMYESDNCDIHGTTAGKVTDEYNLFEIRDIASNYITVEYDGYWYAGGAHGEPLYIYYLFDKSTGDEVTLKDLYKGSEEDFKKLVANATLKYSETFSDDNYPFFNSGQDLYDSAYEYSSIESAIIWENDGIKVVFDPYALGPYAAGPIEIAISYKDLGIEGYFK
ncbi:MAG: DUF3298 domain-containing protein, partial [Lachnospiraceae bacterium]|nr:DUF3298 domain-containing protein [Lachnospiraceae bacterium]